MEIVDPETQPYDLDPLAAGEGGAGAGGFHMLRALGSGAAGEVALCEDATTGVPFALRTIAPGVLTDETLEQLADHTLVAGGTRHPGLARVLWASRSAEGGLMIATEYIEGTTLRDTLIEQGSMPWETVRRLGIRLADALEAAHEVGVVHGDLRPANVYLVPRDGAEEPDFQPVLSDFGLAPAIGGADFVTEYTSPEHLAGVAIDPRADVFALGCVLYEMLCGSVPFSNAHGREVLAERQSSPPDPLRARRPDVDIPEEGERIVLRALAFDRETRFHSMAEMRDALKAAPAAGPKKRASGRRTSSGEIEIGGAPRTPTPPSGEPIVAREPSIEIRTGELAGAPGSTMRGLPPLPVDPSVIGLAGRTVIGLTAPPVPPLPMAEPAPASRSGSAPVLRSPVPPAPVEEPTPASRSGAAPVVRSFVSEQVARSRPHAVEPPPPEPPRAERAERAENVSKATQLEFGALPAPRSEVVVEVEAAPAPPPPPAERPVSPIVGRTLVGLGPLIDIISRRVRGQSAPQPSDAVPERPRFQIDDSEVYARRRTAQHRRRTARRVVFWLGSIAAVAGGLWYAWARSRGLI